MNTHRRSERGQVLIFVVFGMLALVGMTGLAVDGGNAYSDRRHAQNAADTAALAAGLTLIRNTDVQTGLLNPGGWTAAHDAGMARAAGNGYNNAGLNTVTVNRCSDSGVNCTLPNPLPPLPDGSADSLSNYVHVAITSHINTYFARVLGIPQMTNAVEAIAKAIPPHPIPWYNGSALVATMPGCKGGGWPNDPFTTTGNSVTLVTGAGGVFVNSDCSNYALTSNNNTSMSSVSGICVVGGVNPGGLLNPAPTHNCSQVDSQLYQQPSVNDSSCTANGTIVTLSPGNYLASPGRYNSTFPNVTPAGTLRLAKGIYCLENGLSLSSNWNFTTDIDGNGTFDGSDGSDEGVLFYVPHGNVTFNGGSNVHIGAINKTGTPLGVKGYLIYLPPTNNSTVKLAGGNGSTFIGTILAPASLMTIEGGSSGDSLNLECQIIGYSVNLAGGGTLNISYSQGQVGSTVTSPILEQYK